MNDKNISIQSLRGYAIILVIISRCSRLFVNTNGANLLNWFGAFGVSIFIFISGFLSFSRHSRDYFPLKMSIEDAVRKIKNKVTNLYPIHVTMLILSIPKTIGLLVMSPLKWMATFIVSGLMLQAWIPIGDVYYSFNLVSWFLSLIILFALLENLMIRIVRKIKCINIELMIGLIMIVQLLFCLLIRNHWFIYVFPLVRTLEFFGGVYCDNVPKENNML